LKKHLGVITPHFFDDHLIIALSRQWVNLYGKIPRFEAIIDKENRLCLIGPKIGDVKNEKL